MSEIDSRRYFQEIARHFLARRGAPFFLSAKDLALVAAWDEAGIPLPVILEGIDRAFENYRKTGQKKEKVLSLLFCERQVIRAFERARERSVGGMRTSGEKPGGLEKVRAEVEKFLERVAPEAAFLKDIYLEALGKLSDRDVPAEVLERLDDEVEKRLWMSASPPEREAAKAELRAAPETLSEADLERAARVRIVKRLREKYRIPYLSFYYY
jgi:hypothetical protein